MVVHTIIGDMFKLAINDNDHLMSMMIRRKPDAALHEPPVGSLFTLHALVTFRHFVWVPAYSYNHLSSVQPNHNVCRSWIVITPISKNR